MININKNNKLSRRAIRFASRSSTWPLFAHEKQKWKLIVLWDNLLLSLTIFYSLPWNFSLSWIQQRHLNSHFLLIWRNLKKEQKAAAVLGMRVAITLLLFLHRFASFETLRALHRCAASSQRHCPNYLRPMSCPPRAISSPELFHIIIVTKVQTETSII